MAKRVRVKLKKCIQNSQEAGSNDSHMISRVFYEMVVNGNKQGSFYSDITQPVGSEYVAEDLEVTAPNGYKGAFDQARCQGDTKLLSTHCRFQKHHHEEQYDCLGIRIRVRC
jgi:hypothetical protein